MGSEDGAREPIASARSLYVHVPFCRRICPYCDFAVTSTAKSPFTQSEFVALLRQELLEYPAGLRLRTLYVGGGTPSALSPEHLSELVDAIRSRHDASHLVEATVEANPEDVGPAFARTIRGLGFNRVSLGVQSFDASSLAILGRRHRREDVARAVYDLREAGLENLNLDLIVAHPTQTIDRLRSDLDEILALAPQHVSCYAMTYEPGTPYARARTRGTLPAIPEDLEAELLRIARATLEAAGLRRYEVSNFARPGFRSVHNLSYWKRSPYLGVGPSAASFDGLRRWQNPKSLKEWAADRSGRGTIEGELLQPGEQLLETFMLGLRRPHGVRWNRLRRDLANELPDDLEGRIAFLVERGLVTNSPTALRPTDRGLELADAITLELLRGHDPDRRQS